MTGSSSRAPSLTASVDLPAPQGPRTKMRSTASILLPQCHVAHEPRVFALREPLRLGAERGKHVGQGVDLGLGIIAEDIAGHSILVTRVADAEADTAELGSQMLVDRAQTVMARGAAAGLH